MNSSTVRLQMLSILTIWATTACLVITLHWLVNDFVLDIVNDWNENIAGDIDEETSLIVTEETYESFSKIFNHDEYHNLNGLSSAIRSADFNNDYEKYLAEHILYLLDAHELKKFYFSPDTVMAIIEPFFNGEDETRIINIKQKTKQWPRIIPLPGSTNVKTLEELSFRNLDEIRGIDEVCVIIYLHDSELTVSNLLRDSITASRIGYDLFKVQGLRTNNSVSAKRSTKFNCLASAISGDGFNGYVGVKSKNLLQLFSALQGIRNFGIPITLVLSLLVGSWLSVRFRKPILELNKTIDQIRHGDLSARVPIANKSDELNKLAVKINGMLDLIENLVFDTRHMADNVAHDLQTPLTRLKTKLQDIYINDEQEKHKLENIFVEVDRLQNFCRELLYLANVESEEIKSTFTKTSLTDVVKKVSDLYRPIMEDSGYDFIVSLPNEPIFLVGNETLLQQALSNCLDNCIKYVPGGENIEVLVVREDNTKLIIRDSGLGVSSEQLKQLSKNFYRAERDRNTPGNGLGLALVKSIIAAHGGDLNLKSKEGFEVHFIFSG